MMLMEEAERIARDEHGSSKLAVISGKKQHHLSSAYTLVSVNTHTTDLQPEAEGVFYNRHLISAIMKEANNNILVCEAVYMIASI